MKKKQYLILPFVNFQRNFLFANFQVWKNTPENWDKYFDKDNTDFLKRHVNKEGTPLKNIYVITTESSNTPYQKWERLVHTLFFLVFPSYAFRFPKVFADNLYFEIWEWDSSVKGRGYNKIDKFVRTVVSSDVNEKIYPDQYIEPGLKVNVDTDSERFSFFEKKFLEDYNSNLLRSISYFFKTQYRNIAHFSEFEDVVNYCSAYQTFLKVKERHDIGKAIANSLADQLQVPPDTKSKLREWMDELYNVRSRYTHGDEVDYTMLNYQNQRHIDIAGQIFQVLVEKQCIPDIQYFGLGEILSKGILESHQIFNETIKLLTQDRAKEYFYSCNGMELDKYLDLLWDLALNTTIRNVVYENKNRLKKALKSLIYLLGSLCNDYLSDKDKKAKFYTEPLEKLQRIISSTHSIEDKIEKIPGISAITCDPYNIREEIKVRDKIPLGIILHAFGNIREVYKGYNRL